MRTHDQEITVDPLAEAQRYVDNAKEILKERGKLDAEHVSYEDPKYVKAAGHYLWHAVLTALEAVFHLKKKRNSRINIERYREQLSVRDKKLLTQVNNAYNILHLDMGYDGIQSKRICDEGFRMANEIIERCKGLLGV